MLCPTKMVPSSSHWFLSRLLKGSTLNIAITEMADEVHVLVSRLILHLPVEPAPGSSFLSWVLVLNCQKQPFTPLVASQGSRALLAQNKLVVMRLSLQVFVTKTELPSENEPCVSAAALLAWMVWSFSAKPGGWLLKDGLYRSAEWEAGKHISKLLQIPPSNSSGQGAQSHTCILV